MSPAKGMVNAAMVCPATPAAPGGVRTTGSLLGGVVPGCRVSLVSLKGKATSERSRRFVMRLLGRVPRGIRCIVMGRTKTSICSTDGLTARRFPGFSIKREDTASVTEHLRSPLTRLMGVSPRSVNIKRCRRSVGRGGLKRTLNNIMRSYMGGINISLGATSSPLLSCVSNVSKALTGGVITCERRGKGFRGEGRLLGMPGLKPGTFRRYTKFVEVRNKAGPLSKADMRPRSCRTTKGLLRGRNFGPRSVTNNGLANLSLAVGSCGGLTRRLKVKRVALQSVIGRLRGPTHSPQSRVPGPVLEASILSVGSLGRKVVLGKAIQGIVSFNMFISVKIRRSKLIRVSRVASHFVGRPLRTIDMKSIMSMGIVDISLRGGQVRLAVEKVRWCVFKCIATGRPRLGMGSCRGCGTCCYNLYRSLGERCNDTNRLALTCSVAFIVVLLASLCRDRAGTRDRHYGVRPLGPRPVLRGRVARCTASVGLVVTCCRLRSS